ncbi:hypothetical protein ACWGNE_21840 [Streptomyces xiamenensis]
MDLEVPCYAHMFGFLQMDGSLSAGKGNRGRLSVEVGHRDIGLLQEFQRITPYYTSISERVRDTNFTSSYHSAVWTLCSLEARTQLMELGLPQGRKSHLVRPPTMSFMAADYWRGVIDADGSLGITAQGLPFLALTTASEALAHAFCAYTRAVTGAERVPARNSRDSIFNIMYTKESAVEMIKHLYYPGSCGLERKQQSAARASRWLRPAGMAKNGPRKRWSATEDRRLLELGKAETAAQELGRSHNACELRLWRLR